VDKWSILAFSAWERTNTFGGEMRFPPRACALVLPLAAALSLSAQGPAHYTQPNARLVQAIELFGKAQYNAAQAELDGVARVVADVHDPMRVEAEYWAAICAVRLYHADAPARLLTFLHDHPESKWVPTAHLEVFRYWFGQKKWKNCLERAPSIDVNTLGPAEQDEFRFKRGYANFQIEDLDKALVDLDAVQRTTGNYTVPATYYASHIAYARGQYETALQGFAKLKGDPAFGGVVPYYIAEILFLQGKYAELNDFAEPLLAESSGARRMGEVQRLVGESKYRQGRYAEAVPHLAASLQRGAGVTREDRYVYGYALYRAELWQQAVDQLNLVTGTTDSLGQAAAYHMADCYLQLDQKNYARTAFKKAYDMGRQEDLGGGQGAITEDALFNYAKLAYDLSFDPYNEAITALRNYLNSYPNSPRSDEAYAFLLDVYLRTRNYEAALEALDRIKLKDLRLKEAYQQVAYDRGAELYDGRRYADAALFFERALQYPMDQDLNARCHYWMGESYYAQADYSAALGKYDDLRNASGAFATDLYELASYSMGYCYFKQKDLAEASTSFRRFAASKGGTPEQRADAMLRAGDCFFVTKDLPAAIQWYSAALAAKTTDPDHALYQKAVCQGLQRDLDGKISTLGELLAERPNGRYSPDAKFQLGETYINMEQDAQALTWYARLLAEHPNSPHTRQALLQTALVHKRQGNDAKALEEFKAIVAKYPTMDGSRDALAGIESIFVEQGNVAAYETYVKGLSFVDPATLDLDEKYYRSAEQLYFAGKCAEAIGAFGSYLLKYPKGGFALNAHYYRGDCAYRAAQYAMALEDLEVVVVSAEPRFIEAALFGTSDVLFRDKRWEAALERFKQLEKVATFPQNVLAAQLGTMRCLRELGRPQEAIASAQKVLADATADAALKAEANMVLARSWLEKNDLEAAYKAFRQAAEQRGAMGAEAKYHMAYVRHLQAKYKDVEKEVFDLANDHGGQDHWITKGFVLLADAYVLLGDRFQAKAALQSVVSNSQEAELVADAQRRLDVLLAEEEHSVTPVPQDEIEVPVPPANATPGP
jgi:TolA-binding protein